MLSSAFHKGFLLAGCLRGSPEAPGAWAGAHWHLPTEAGKARSGGRRDGSRGGRPRGQWVLLLGDLQNLLERGPGLPAPGVTAWELVGPDGPSGSCQHQPASCSVRKGVKRVGRKEGGMKGRRGRTSSANWAKQRKKSGSHMFSLTGSELIHSRKTDILTFTHSFLYPFCKYRASIPALFLLQTHLAQSHPFTSLSHSGYLHHGSHDLFSGPKSKTSSLSHEQPNGISCIILRQIIPMSHCALCSVKSTIFYSKKKMVIQSVSFHDWVLRIFPSFPFRCNLAHMLNYVLIEESTHIHTKITHY